MLLLSDRLQGDVVGHPLSLCEVLRLVLRDDVPGDPVVDAVLQQHGLVHGVGATQVAVAAVCLRRTPNLQNKHDFAEQTQGKPCVNKSQEVFKELYVLLFLSFSFLKSIIFTFII